jgi:hypothetical protein
MSLSSSNGTIVNVPNVSSFFFLIVLPFVYYHFVVSVHCQGNCFFLRSMPTIGMNAMGESSEPKVPSVGRSIIGPRGNRAMGGFALGRASRAVSAGGKVQVTKGAAPVLRKFLKKTLRSIALFSFFILSSISVLPNPIFAISVLEKPPCQAPLPFPAKAE